MQHLSSELRMWILLEAHLNCRLRGLLTAFLQGLNLTFLWHLHKQRSIKSLPSKLFQSWSLKPFIQICPPLALDELVMEDELMN